jgi:hypothetical protein
MIGKRTLFAILAAAIVACSASYPSITRGGDGEWTISMPGTQNSLRTKLEFDAPAGSKLSQGRTVQLTAWRSSALSGMFAARTIGGFAELVAKAQATKFFGNTRVWTSPLGDVSGGLSCKLWVTKEASDPIAAAVVCTASDVIEGVDVVVQRVGKVDQSVRIRANSKAGPLAEFGNAGLVTEFSHKGTKTQISYVWAAVSVPIAVAFGTESMRVALTFAADVSTPAPPPNQPVVQREATDPAAEALVPVIPKLGAGLQTIEDVNITGRTYGGLVPPSQWWYGIAVAGALLIGGGIGFGVIIARMKKPKKLRSSEPR